MIDVLWPWHAAAMFDSAMDNADAHPPGRAVQSDPRLKAPSFKL